MPTIIGILTFMSRMNLSLSRVEHEKLFNNLGARTAIEQDTFGCQHYWLILRKKAMTRTLNHKINQNTVKLKTETRGPLVL